MSKDKLRKNGGEGTKVGNFLRSINFKDVAGVVTNVVTGNVKGAIDILKGSSDLSPQQLEMALKELEMDVVEMQEVTKRWQSDMNSDSWLSKNVRPLSLAFLTISLFIYIILDSSLNSFSVADNWIELLGSLLLLVYGGYFGMRSVEKVAQTWKDKHNNK
jgi:hypothetical protein